MAYVTTAELQALLPDEYRDAAVDDAGTGPVTGLLDEVAAAASRECDGLIEARFATPVTASPIPSKLRQAALWIALEMLFTRRGATPPERVAKAADGWRDVLRAVGKGETALAAPAAAESAIISEPSRTYSGGRLMV